MAWTDEKVELLTRLWQQGKSASEISAELGDVTRNAVIGKAHRLGLASRPSPIKRQPKPAPVEPIGVKLIDLTERMCKWPIGDPATPGFRFCGKPSATGQSYCEGHMAMAYQAPSSKKDRERNRQAAATRAANF
jgi:GcrA cell cycle regulator